MEGAAVPFAIRVHTDTTEPWVLVVPTTLRYRVDDLTTGASVLPWTTVSPASTATITVTGKDGKVHMGTAIVYLTESDVPAEELEAVNVKPDTK